MIILSPAKIRVPTTFRHFDYGKRLESQCLCEKWIRRMPQNGCLLSNSGVGNQAVNAVKPPPNEKAPKLIKKTVTGSGMASKFQVTEMVKKLLGVIPPRVSCSYIKTDVSFFLAAANVAFETAL